MRSRAHSYALITLHAAFVWICALGRDICIVSHALDTVQSKSVTKTAHRNDACADRSDLVGTLEIGCRAYDETHAPTSTVESTVGRLNWIFQCARARAHGMHYVYIHIYVMRYIPLNGAAAMLESNARVHARGVLRRALMEAHACLSCDLN